MAKIYPFRALRYDSAKVSPDQVVTQPYDKISPAMQDRYYAASPYNLVRIILGKAEPGDDEKSNVYSRAAANLEHWREAEVLVRDAEPSVYLYTQSFKVPGDPAGTRLERRGFIAAGQLEEYDKKIVFRHEQTLSKPKADRLNLLRATQSHFGQIFMLYSDPAGGVDATLRQSRPPDVEVTDEYDVIHRLWKISDTAIIAKVQAAMNDKKLIIADGHHRYETALNYRNDMRQRSGNNGNAPYERLMMTFVNMDSSGLVVLPTHRVVFGLDGFDVAAMNDEAEQVLRRGRSGSHNRRQVRDGTPAGVGQDAFCIVGRDREGRLPATLALNTRLSRSRGPVGTPARARRRAIAQAGVGRDTGDVGRRYP